MKLIYVSRALPFVIASFLFAASGAALASAGNNRPLATHVSIPGQPVSTPCSNSVILSTGGLCCPHSRGSTESCSQTRRKIIYPSMARTKPLVINGVIIPLPIIAQMVEKGLRRSWSPAVADRNLLVCGYGSSSTLLPTLHCLSNKAYFRHHSDKHLDYDPTKVKIRCYANCFLTQGNITASIIHYIDFSSHRARLISTLANKVPDIGASYSLRVPETVPMRFPALHKIVKYPVFITFYIQKGDLSNIELAKRNGPSGISIK